MFWADRVAQELKTRKLPLEWVDDMKTPSGRVHVGALMGVVFHDLVFKALKDTKVPTKYTYVMENHDPMDDIPSYLPREKFEQYLGMPLFKIPSPEPGYKDYADFFAQEFINTFQAIGCEPEILWTKDLYTSGKMNPGIKTILDNAQTVRDIYKELYKKEIASDWYPFQVYCEQCGKVSTTRVYNWDGGSVHYKCPVDAIEWTKGCGYEGKTSPFSDESGIKGKMPWKVEWAAKWQAIGVTVEGAGKDHMSRGGSHDLASLVCERVFHYPVPYPVGYEFMLIGGKKMSSSKGRGFAASDILTILPPELARFLIVRMDITQQTNFDPAERETIPSLFDEYQEYAKHYFEKKNDDYARVFELSQVGDVKTVPQVRFSTLAQWVQMPNMQKKIEEERLSEWAKYARVWVEKYAPESEKYTVQKELPKVVRKLSDDQKKYLQEVAQALEKDITAEELQTLLYEKAQSMNLPTKEAFAAIYLSLLGKPNGPKAGFLLLSLEKQFISERFEQVSNFANEEINSLATSREDQGINALNNLNIFSINKELKGKFPSILVGIAVIKEVEIREKDENLEKEKEHVLQSLEGLTTEQLSEYPEIKSYRRLYKETGIDWHSRRPSPEALLRRIALKKGLYSVNTCVDAYNLVVVKHRISVGAFDYDKVSFPTELRLAEGGEKILLLGDKEPTTYKPGEVAYFDQKGPYNIDFNYRDAQRTAVHIDTKNLYINVDGVYEITAQMVEKVLRETCDIITKYCAGTIEEFGIEIVA